VQVGDLPRASALLGRPCSLLGTVIPGDQRGRTLGFPTANLRLHHELRPPYGVYAAQLLRRGELLPAVVNIGERPTFAAEDIQVEAHLLDFHGDLYGEVLEVFLLKRLRPEKAFASEMALKEQIHVDIGQCREVLIDPPPPTAADFLKMS
jgi:riboflavin kinase/FMN adenylyltransferase